MAETIATPKVQEIRGPDGRVSHYVLSPDEYGRLTSAAEDTADLEAGRRVRAEIAGGADELVPAAIAERLMDGENPVRVWRDHRGLSQQQLAAQAGVTRGMISHIETGKSGMSLEHAASIARALGVSTNDLVPANMAEVDDVAGEAAAGSAPGAGVRLAPDD
ncbi:MAG: helix-turn-helix transcriptional regulator [Alphaproteobacteria bacterium]|jgi:DNA-binding XRE family transcriptional regulator|nr:helix-turn-helix transcriptional regulator [Alphaproteobacteria bacterium]MDP6564430.1 helix-turn-helix transcriptional regulator [Alphaproteobacteria bacterium]MDP6813433.1 helix-turn-helix transcriptional regulator [Alphaproteobacteria bacterium]